MEDKASIIRQIRELAQKRGAVILAHNYELGEIQDAADFQGDSLELAIHAAQTEAEEIVFCGVRFMAETAKILSPDKRVILPAGNAGCAMADMADADALRKLKAQHPGAMVVCYVNSTAAVKAECDMCVTSANAVKIVQSLPRDREVIFVPDKNLGAYCAAQAKRELILWDGCCPVHERMTPEMIARKRAEFPGVPILMHPEAAPETAALADELLSTGGILRFVRESSAKKFIIATEIGILHRLEQEHPEKVFIPLTAQAVCPDMKLIRLPDLLRALETGETEITLPEELRSRAEKPIRAMLNA